MNNSTENIFNRQLQIAKLIISILTLVAVGFYGTYLTNLSKSKEVNQKYVELSILILSKKLDIENKEKDQIIRKWAIETLDKCAPVKFSESAKKILLTNPIQIYGVHCNDGSWAASIEGCKDYDSLNIIKNNN